MMLDLIPYALMFLAGFATSRAILAYAHYQRMKAFMRFLDHIASKRELGHGHD